MLTFTIQIPDSVADLVFELTQFCHERKLPIRMEKEVRSKPQEKPARRPKVRTYGVVKGKNVKGHLRPNPDTGGPSSRVLILRSVRESPKTDAELHKLFDYAGHSTIRQGISRNIATGFIRAELGAEGDQDALYALTASGLAALERFNLEYPALCNCGGSESIGHQPGCPVGTTNE